MITSKLPNVGTTIFTRMSQLATETGALNLSQGFPDFDGPHPQFYNEMPSGYKTVVVAGITYFVLDNLWYLMHGNKYEQVATPTNVTVINNPPAVVQTSSNPGMNVVDVNGLRYYVKDGRYYRRDVNGQLLEVTPPL